MLIYDLDSSQQPGEAVLTTHKDLLEATPPEAGGQLEVGQGLKQRAPSRGPEPSDLGELPFPEPSDLGELPFSDLPGREDPPTQPEPSYEMTPTNHIVYIKEVLEQACRRTWVLDIAGRWLCDQNLASHTLRCHLTSSGRPRAPHHSTSLQAESTAKPLSCRELRGQVTRVTPVSPTTCETWSEQRPSETTLEG